MPKRGEDLGSQFIEIQHCSKDTDWEWSVERRKVSMLPDTQGSSCRSRAIASWAELPQFLDRDIVQIGGARRSFQFRDQLGASSSECRSITHTPDAILQRSSLDSMSILGFARSWRATLDKAFALINATRRGF
jgi:hypothetical protein